LDIRRIFLQWGWWDSGTGSWEKLLSHKRSSLLGVQHQAVDVIGSAQGQTGW